MTPSLRRAAVLTAAFTLAATGIAAPTPAAADEPFPQFVFQGVITDKPSMIYNPTDEYIFPSLFHAGEHLADPLAEWYLYLAPHDPPGGLMLMYSDSLDGPWTEHPGNPIIEEEWGDHYDVSHVSSPDAIWNEETGRVFLYFHGENSVTRYASSADGVSFEYGDVAVSNAMGGTGVTESSYARVFAHPDPDSGYRYGMLYMANYHDNHRRLRYAESVDGMDWHVRPDPVVSPVDGDGGNVSGGNLWQWDGQLYVIYHNSTGNSMARPVDPTLTEIGPAQLLHAASGVGPDTGRVAAPEIVSAGEHTYLFYEAGHRLGATVAYAKAGPGVEFPGGYDPVDWPVDPDNPVFDQCAATGSDEFEGDAVSGVWDRVVRPDAARHQVTGGALTIPTYLGGVAAAPLLQQQIPDGPWQLTTKVHIEATQRFQQAGLLLYATDGAYGKFDLVQATPGLRLEVVQLVGANNRQDTAAPAVAGATDVWLRLSSDGSSVQPSVSYDGASFTDYMRPFELGHGFDHIGPFAFRGDAGAPEIEATFDWFRWSPTPEAYAECLGDLLPPDDETAPPAAGVLSSTSGWAYGLADGNYDVRMNLWWGSNATRFRLYENDQLIATVPLTPATPWAQHATVPVTNRPNGSYTYRGELVNSQGTTGTAPLTVNVTDAAPRTPVLSHDDWDSDGTFTLTANLWWGTNASSWRLLQNGEEIATGDLAPATPAAQRVEVPITGLAGERTFVIEFTNHAGTTASQPLTIRPRTTSASPAP